MGLYDQINGYPVKVLSMLNEQPFTNINLNENKSRVYSKILHKQTKSYHLHAFTFIKGTYIYVTYIKRVLARNIRIL